MINFADMKTNEEIISYAKSEIDYAKEMKEIMFLPESEVSRAKYEGYITAMENLINFIEEK